MNFKQLEYFVAVAEAKSISKAARKLHVAQPPISRQIAMLEDELKVCPTEFNRWSPCITGICPRHSTERAAGRIPKATTGLPRIRMWFPVRWGIGSDTG